MQRKFLFAGAAVAVAALVAQGASATSINFGAMTPGTYLTAPVSGVTATLSGGPDSSGAPVIGYGFEDTVASLDNSTNWGLGTTGYPTAEVLNFAFSTAATNVSFTFNNYGDNDTFYTAYGPKGIVISTGDIGTVNGFATVNVAGSGIDDIQIDNNEGGGNWIFGVGALNFSAVPEPFVWTMMLTGLFGMGAMLRYRRENAPATLSV